MMLAVRALAWEILARYRWFVGGSAVWLLVACLIAALLPESRRVPNTAALMLGPALFGVIAYLTALTRETRLDTRAGGFSRRLLLLPVSAGVLAGVPLALALGVPTLVWMVAAVGVLRPCGVRVAVFWPGLYFGVVLAWLLALGWSPMPLRWARLAIISVVVATFSTGAVLVLPEMFAWPEYAILLGLVVLARIAVGLAVRGVSRSRCEGIESSEAAPSAARGGGVSVAPFRSRLRAQLWLEWRTHGRMFAILTFVLGLFSIPAVALTESTLRTHPYLYRDIASESLRELGPAWLALSWLLLIPLLMAGVSGGEMGKFARKQKSFQVPAFVGLLPVTTADLVKGKFIAPAIHLASMWGILLAFALGWAVIGGHAIDMAERLTAVCGSPAMAWLTLLATLLSAYLITYLICVGSIWGGLFGSPLLAPLPALLGMLEIGLMVWIKSYWEPGYAPMLLSALWVAFAFELLLVEYLVYYNQKRIRVGWRGLSVALLLWAACAGVPAGTVAWLTGEPMAALAVVVLSPLVSCLAAPAVLHRSRHGAWA